MRHILLSISLVVLRKGMQSDKSRGHTSSEEHRREGDGELHCCRFCLLAIDLCGHKRFAFQRIVRKGEDVLMVGMTIIHKRRFFTYVKMHQSHRIVVGSTAYRHGVNIGFHRFFMKSCSTFEIWFQTPTFAFYYWIEVPREASCLKFENAETARFGARTATRFSCDPNNTNFRVDVRSFNFSHSHGMIDRMLR